MEEEKPEIIKRGRGRPRKHPVNENKNNVGRPRKLPPGEHRWKYKKITHNEYEKLKKIEKKYNEILATLNNPEK